MWWKWATSGPNPAQISAAFMSLQTHHADELRQGHLQNDGDALRAVDGRPDQLVVAVFTQEPVHQTLLGIRTHTTCTGIMGKHGWEDHGIAWVRGNARFVYGLHIQHNTSHIQTHLYSFIHFFIYSHADTYTVVEYIFRSALCQHYANIHTFALIPFFVLCYSELKPAEELK